MLYTCENTKEDLKNADMKSAIAHKSYKPAINFDKLLIRLKVNNKNGKKFSYTST